MKTYRFFVVIVCLAGNLSATAQVKIGDTSGAVNPRAVLELKDTTRGFLLSHLTNSQMNAITGAPDGLLVFNSTASDIFRFKQSSNSWMRVRSDSGEWFLDTLSKKLYLRSALANNDSIYYNTVSKKFLFADKRTYTGSTGSLFNLDEGNSDRFVFKTTASKFERPATNLNSANLYAVYEADNDTAALSQPYVANYTGVSAVAISTPGATQKISSITGMGSGVAHGGSDTLQELDGIFNSAFVRGGFTETMDGILNNIGIGATATSNVGSMFGINTVLSYPAGGMQRILGPVYGYYLSQSPNMTGKADGPAYGFYARNITASAFSNWAVYTNKGANRFGDSVVITDGLVAARPRAILDVNTSSAMIIPTGTTAQRPVTMYPGMLRMNTTTSGAEVYNGTSWTNLNPIISATILIDPPSVGAATTTTITVSLPGATPGNTVTLSPAAGLPSGYIIAWARVSAQDFVEIAFGNLTGAGVNPAQQNFFLKVIR